jgi:hypothetical protein
MRIGGSCCVDRATNHGLRIQKSIKKAASVARRRPGRVLLDARLESHGSWGWCYTTFVLAMLRSRDCPCLQHERDSRHGDSMRNGRWPMAIAIAQWLKSCSFNSRAHCRSHIRRDPLLLFGGVIIAAAFLWPVVFLAFLLLLYGSRILA